MKPQKIHPLIPEARNELQKGNLSRRDFLRLSSLLGLSVATSQFLAACSPKDTPTSTEETAVIEPTAEVVATTIKRGGVLRCATRVERVDHPARF